MSQPADMIPTLTHEQLPHLHQVTAEIQKIVRAQLRSYLDALAPLFRPRRVLGERMEGSGKEAVVGADLNYAELREMYFKACGRPFDMRKEFPPTLESVGTQIGLHEWEYSYTVRTERDSRTITVISPLTWVLSYPSTYNLSMLRHVIGGKQDHDAEGVRTYVLRSCIMSLQFEKLPDLKALFQGLRYHVEVRKSPQLGELPLVTVSAPIRTIRPVDDLLLNAIALTGRTAFEEVIDEYQASHIADPLQAQTLKVLDKSDAKETEQQN